MRRAGHAVPVGPVLLSGAAHPGGRWLFAVQHRPCPDDLSADDGPVRPVLRPLGRGAPAGRPASQDRPGRAHRRPGCAAGLVLARSGRHRGLPVPAGAGAGPVDHTPVVHDGQLRPPWAWPSFRPGSRAVPPGRAQRIGRRPGPGRCGGGPARPARHTPLVRFVDHWRRPALRLWAVALRFRCLRQSPMNVPAPSSRIRRRLLRAALSTGLLGGAAPWVARAADRRRILMITYRGRTEVEDGFLEYLRAQGRTPEIIQRDVGQDVRRLPAILDEIPRLAPDLIYTWGTPVTLGVAGTWQDPDPSG